MQRLMSWTYMQSFSFIPLTASEEKIFEYFFEILTFMLPWQPIKFSNLDKIHMDRRDLLKKYFCEKKILNICSETAKIANFHFSHYKSMETISFHSNQSSYPIGTKNTVIRSPVYRCYMWNLVRIGFNGFRGAVVWKCWRTMDRWTTDGCLPILKAHLWAFGLGELKKKGSYYLHI